MTRLKYNGAVNASTGLPELPEGHVWRVRQYDSVNYAYIELCAVSSQTYGFLQRKTRPVYTVLDDAIVRYRELSEDTIWNRAVCIIEKWPGPKHDPAQLLVSTRRRVSDYEGPNLRVPT